MMHSFPRVLALFTAVYAGLGDGASPADSLRGSQSHLSLLVKLMEPRVRQRQQSKCDHLIRSARLQHHGRHRENVTPGDRDCEQEENWAEIKEKIKKGK
ncbi:Endonuclease MutS2 [Frankliniella fusca]|uniref:Endonuclease MutS2 n=1 Tax=Frankliniella fusca TaxID=407009 RepID=A0AAE1GRA5_9NEOP|nr:Endonuclease MutS2 [Frankliniella fusca]